MNSGFLEENNITSLITTVRNNVKQEINYDITHEPKYINVLKKLVKTIHKANLNTNVSTQYMNNLVVTKCVPFLVNQIGKTNHSKKSQNVNVYGNLPLNTSLRPQATRTSDTALKKANVLPGQDQTDFSNLVLGNSAMPMSNPPLAPISNPNRSLEPPSRQMPSLSNNSNPINNSIPNMNNMNGMNENIKMDISNLPTPLPNGNEFDNAPLINPKQNRETNNFVNNLAGINSKDVDENIDFTSRLEEMQREREYANNTNMANKDVQKSLEEKRENTNANNDEFFKKLAENNVTETPNTDQRDNELSLMNSTNLNKNYMETDVSNYSLDESAYNAYENNIIQLGNQNPSQARVNVSNLENNIRDQSQNVNGDLNPGISNMVTEKENEVGKDVSKEYMDKTFISTNYQFERRKRKIVCLDISENLANMTVDGVNSKKVIQNISNSYWGRFRINLQEDLIIDKVSDVFIESIIINNPAQATPLSSLYIIMDIEEFNIKTLSNNSLMMDKFVLPNENTESVGSSKIMKYHLKSNYVATVNPTRLSSLTFNITNEDGDSVINSFTSSTKTLSDSYNAGTTGNIGINNLEANSFRIFDAVYNSSYQFIGNILATSTNNHYVLFTKSTNVNLIQNETLYFPSSKTSNFFTVAGSYGDTTITVDSDPNVDFNVGDKVYVGTGVVLGKISAMNAGDPSTITFESPITRYMPIGVALYTSNPLPHVFASNDKSNRIILELVIMAR